MKELDKALKEIAGHMEKKEEAKKKQLPFLNSQLSKIEKIDMEIKKAENYISAKERQKQKELQVMQDQLDLAMISIHSLENGYTVKPDNRMKVEILDIGNFFIWLKANKKPSEVLDFFKGAIKVTNLKRFCEREFNEQKNNGEMKPVVGGVEFGPVTFARLRTEYKEIKKNQVPLNNVQINSSRTQRKIKK